MEGMKKVDAQIIEHLETVGPYFKNQLILPFDGGEFGVCRDASPAVAARVVREMPGRFSYQQACDFLDYHACDGYVNVDVVVEELLKKTTCTREERDEMIIAHGSEKMAAPIYQREEEQYRKQQAAAKAAAQAARNRKKPAPSFFGMLLGAATGNAMSEGFAGRDAASGEPAFQDFNNAWGSNNDHNWSADGDTQWDSHGDGLPSGE